MKNLSSLQLSYLYEHLRLGEQHLKEILTKQQFKQLLDSSHLSNMEKENIHADKMEKSGNVNLILNTIVTSTFGAWLGLTAFTGLKLTSYPILLLIVSVTTIVGSVLGYCSFKLTKAGALSAIVKQKLSKLQLEVLEIINKKHEQSISKIIEKLNNFFEEFYENNAEKIKIHSGEELSEWLIKFNVNLDKKINFILQNENYKKLVFELKAVKKNLEKIIFKKITVIKTEDFTKPEKYKSDKDASMYCIDVLTNPNIAMPKQKAAMQSWVKGNLPNILVNLIPTLLGGFASMFVFLSPGFAKQFVAHDMFALLASPVARSIELFLAISLTSYYGFSSVYNYRKTFKRNEELQKIQKEIVNQETTMLETNARLAMFKKIKSQIRRIKVVQDMLTIVVAHYSQQN